MNRLATALIILAFMTMVAPAAISTATTTTAARPSEDFWTKLNDAIGQHWGNPYVIGTSGLKSFDCSGFVWRALTDSGVYLKRTSARKLFLSLPPAPEAASSRFGTIVFFDNLRHCGIVNDADSFYHAECRKGTNLSPLQPYWQNKICGFRLFL